MDNESAVKKIGPPNLGAPIHFKVPSKEEQIKDGPPSILTYEPSKEEEIRDGIDILREYANSWDHKPINEKYVWTEQTENIYRDIFLKHYGIMIISGEQGSGKDALRIGIKDRRIEGYKYHPDLIEFLNRARALSKRVSLPLSRSPRSRATSLIL